jgi:hypothetical protein
MECPPRPLRFIPNAQVHIHEHMLSDQGLYCGSFHPLIHRGWPSMSNRG